MSRVVLLFFTSVCSSWAARTSECKRGHGIKDSIKKNNNPKVLAHSVVGQQTQLPQKGPPRVFHAGVLLTVDQKKAIQARGGKSMSDENVCCVNRGLQLVGSELRRQVFKGQRHVVEIELRRKIRQRKVAEIVDTALKKGGLDLDKVTQHHSTLFDGAGEKGQIYALMMRTEISILKEQAMDEFRLGKRESPALTREEIRECILLRENLQLQQEHMWRQLNHPTRAKMVALSHAERQPNFPKEVLMKVASIYDVFVADLAAFLTNAVPTALCVGLYLLISYYWITVVWFSVWIFIYEIGEWVLNRNLYLKCMFGFAMAMGGVLFRNLFVDDPPDEFQQRRQHFFKLFFYIFISI